MSGGMTSVDKARGLLKQLFRTENADLDFGIYRIMNFKRAEIERFIDKDLIEAAEAEFKEFARAGAAELEKELNKRRREINDFVPGTIGEDWVVLKNHDLPRVKEFIGVLEEYRTASVSEEQVQDVFNHVYEFFSRYYEDGDFIPRTRYGGRGKYFVPYNGEEVLLHWATKDMYYVKTGEYLNKYSFRAGRFRVTFRLVEAQIERGNVKSDRKFFILHDEDPVTSSETLDEVEIRFNYRTLTDEEKERYGRRTSAKIQEDLIDEALTKIGASLGISSISGTLHPLGNGEKSLMRRHLEAYVERNTKDFFIHKHLKGFLSKELEFYLKNEVWGLNVFENTSGSQTNLMIAKVKAIRGISTKIIEFLAQIEEFQKRLFEKRKFVLRTGYCITLDLIPEELYEEIGNNEEQCMEWEELFNLKEETKGTLLSIDDSDTLDAEFLKAQKHLVLDTRHFSLEFKDKLLARFDGIDDLIDGIMIKSESYQALNLLLSKYSEQVKCTYIDPPFNTGSDEFLYKDNYRHSSWLSLMYDRLLQAKSLLANDGSIYVHIDYNENSRLRLLLNETFGSHNFRSENIWKRLTYKQTQVKAYGVIHDGIFYYTKSDSYVWNDVRRPYGKDRLTKYFCWLETPSGKNIKLSKDQLEGKKPNLEGRRFALNPLININPNRPHLHYEFLGFERTWKYTKEKMTDYYKKGEVFQPSPGSLPQRKQYLDESEGMKINDIWLDVSAVMGGSKEYLGFDTQKPEALLQRIILMSSNPEDHILDYLLGSGTTTAVAHKLGRKWIGIEMGDHFETVAVARMKEVLARRGKHEPCGITEDVGWEGGGFFKYQILEQYEDTLNNIVFIQSDSSIQSRLDRLPDYFLTYMLDYETKDSPTRISFEKFKTPFNYRIKTISGGEEKEEPVDLVETFNYLLGLHINLFRAFKDGDRLYKAVYGTRGNEQVVVVWRDTPDLDLKQDKEFIENTVLSDITPDTIYINGDSYLESAKPIEPEFKRLMGA